MNVNLIKLLVLSLKNKINKNLYNKVKLKKKIKKSS